MQQYSSYLLAAAVLCCSGLKYSNTDFISAWKFGSKKNGKERRSVVAPARCRTLCVYVYIYIYVRVCVCAQHTCNTMIRI
jgi:hypothetical protein